MTRKKLTRRRFFGGTTAVGASAALSPAFAGSASAEAPSDTRMRFSSRRPTTYNTHAIAYSDLGGRGGGFKLAIQEVQGKWYLYMGHLWHGGWTIVDVTDPGSPEVVNFIEGPSNTWTIQMDVEEGRMVTALERMPPSWGGDPSAPFDEGVLIWDLEDDPVHPKLLGHFRTGGTGTHRNGYPGGRYVHLAAGMPGYSVLPMPGRGIAVANSEAIASRGMEPLNHASTVDISDPSRPRLLAVFPLPEPPPGAPFESFYDRGGRFGPHNTSMLYHSPFTDHSDKLIYLTYFNAGLRIFDIEDPRTPEEVGYFIPPDPTHRFGPQPPDALVLQSEDVLVDTRGNIYLSNKNQGLWILRYTGPSYRASR